MPHAGDYLIFRESSLLRVCVTVTGLQHWYQARTIYGGRVTNGEWGQDGDRGVKITRGSQHWTHRGGTRSLEITASQRGSGFKGYRDKEYYFWYLSQTNRSCDHQTSSDLPRCFPMTELTSFSPGRGTKWRSGWAAWPGRYCETRPGTPDTLILTL